MVSLKANQLTKVYLSQTGELLNSENKYDSYDRLVSSLKKNDKLALDKVNLELKAGDRLGIIGPNGAGKSTLLSILAGISKQTLGTVEIEGRITAILTLGIGLREDLSGRENIYLDGELQGKSRKEIDLLIDSIIEFSELGKFIDYPVRTYSTGMKSRLVFSMLINIEPEILIIDEALSAGDVFFAGKATKAINDICNKGKIVIIVSHSMVTINTMCNRCLWMKKGKIIMDDAPDRVTKAYLQEVHQQDESELFKKFRKKIVNISHADGCNIHTLETSRFSDPSDIDYFNTEEDFRIHIAGSLQQIANPRLRFSIERLDGMPITEEYYKIQEHHFSYDIELESLVLANGIYLLMVELLSENEVKAKRAKIIEVVMLEPPSGGRTTLNYPCEITLTEINEQEEYHVGI